MFFQLTTKTIYMIQIAHIKTTFLQANTLLNSEKMTRNDTVYSFIKPLWNVGQILGLSNRSLSPKTRLPEKQKRYYILLYRYCYNALVLCVLGKIVHTTCTIQFNAKYNITLEFTEFIIAGTNCLCAVLSATFSLTNLGQLSAIIRQIHKVDMRLKKYCKCKWITYTSLRWFVVIETTAIVFSWALFLVYYLFILECKKYDDINRLMVWFFRYLPTFMIYFYMMQFVALALVLRRQSVMINDHLSQIENKDGAEGSLLQAMELFHDVSQACVKLNSLYSLPILVKFANQITQIFCFCYFCIFGYTFCGEYVNPKTSSDYLLPVFATIPFFIEFVTVVVICEWVAGERVKTGKIIQKMHTTAVNCTLQVLVSLFERCF